MIAFILIVGALNIAVGYVGAMLLVAPSEAIRRPALPAWLRRPTLSDAAQLSRWAVTRLRSLLQRKPNEPLVDADDPFSAAAEAFAEETPVKPTTIFDNMPQPWAQSLAAAGVDPKSFIEAAAHYLRAEVGRYREQLIACETQARSALTAEDAAACELVLNDIRRANRDWRKLLREATKTLADQHEPLEGYEALRQAIHERLDEQASQLEASSAALDALDLHHDPAAPKRIVHELGRLIDFAHALREPLAETQAIISRIDGRLTDLPSGFQIDPQTTLLTRLGFEKTLFDWRAGDPARLRPCALVMIDIDRFGKLNERLGTRAGDRLLATIGREFSRFVRKERGFDRACRIGGGRFLYFLGDTNSAQGLNAAERLRQSVEALTVNCDGNDVEFTVSCGVCEPQCDETSEQLLTRLSGLLHEARKAGRNRTAVDNGDGAEVITEPQRFQVKAKMVTAPEA